MSLLLPVIILGILIALIIFLLSKIGKEKPRAVVREEVEETKEQISMHELQKAERKKRKEQEREEKEKAEQNKEAKKQLKQDKYLAKIKQREEERNKALEEQKAELEIKKKQEEDVYLQWKESFAVEEVKEDLEDPNKLQAFIQYIAKHKFVDLQLLCNEFNLLTSEAVDRIKNLELQGRLNGIFDARGAYIYFTDDELKGVHDYIKQCGRIDKMQLIEYCDSLLSKAN